MAFAKQSKKALKRHIDSVGGSDYPTFLKKDFKDRRYKIKVKNFIRILPPVDPDNDFARLLYVHEYVGVDKGSYLCREKMLGDKETCPICQVYRKAMKIDEDAAYKLKPKQKYLFWIIDISKDPQSDEPLLLVAPKRGLADEILSRAQDKESGEALDISDPEDGRKIYFEKTGQGERTRYGSVDISEKPFPVKEKIAKIMAPFDEVLRFVKASKLEVVADEIDIDDLDSKSNKKKGGDEDEDDRVERKSSKHKQEDDEEEDNKHKKKSSKYEDDEDFNF